MNNSLTEVQISTLSEDSPINSPDVKPVFDAFLDERLELLITQVEIAKDNEEWVDFERHHPIARNLLQKALSKLHIHYSEF